MSESIEAKNISEEAGSEIPSEIEESKSFVGFGFIALLSLEVVVGVVLVGGAGVDEPNSHDNEGVIITVDSNEIYIVACKNDGDDDGLFILPETTLQVSSDNWNVLYSMKRSMRQVDR